MALIEWINEIENQTVWKDRDHAIYDNEDVRIKKLKMFGLVIYKTIRKQDSKCELSEFNKEGKIGGFASSLFDKPKS